jgi:predicted O-methyltransferase YrrM
MSERLPAHVLTAPTMLARGELALLYVLARDHARENAIIDAGCFFGGSSVALAAGLEASGAAPAGRIHTYDLFVLDEVYKRTSPHLVDGMEAGDSFLPLFERTVGERLLPYLDVHAGDLLAYPWGGGPIDVLFVDIAKAWELNDHVVREFFPALVPGHSVVVQQDYVHEALPWLHITMDLFADALELVDFVPGTGSAVFVCTRAISSEEADIRLRDMPAAEQLARFARAASPFRGTERGVIEIARAVLLDQIGDRAAAVAHFESVAAEHAGDARVQEGIEAFRGRFE